MELHTLHDQLCNSVREMVAHVPFAKSLIASEKGRHDYVTQLDVWYEQQIEQRLTKLRPEWPVISEEQAKSQPMPEGYCWLVDPLDGTFNVVHNLPFHSISIALMLDGEPVLAVVYDSGASSLYSAIKGRGAYCDGDALQVNGCAHEVIAISSGFVDWALERDPSILAGLRKLGKIRILGSQGLQLAYVGAGNLSANLSVEAKPWDDAAGCLIATESGAVYNDFSGAALFPLAAGEVHAQTLQSIAATPELWQKIQPLLTPHLKKEAA